MQETSNKTAVEQVAAEQKEIPALEATDEKYTSASWHIDPAIKASAGVVQSHKLLAAGAEDIHKVVTSYQRSPVPGYSIQKVEIIYNPRLNRAFGLNLDLLEARHASTAFSPAWREEQDAHTPQRQATHDLLETMARPYQDPIHPHLLLMPLWHATNADILPSLFNTGFANLSTVDPGFFGKGLYSAGEASYAQGVYGKMYARPALLMNWVATYSAYPVIHGDQPKLQGKGNFRNHDAHFIPVVPQSPNDPNEVNFYPCRPSQKHKYTEMVVFEKAQCLPRYLVTLQNDAPNSSVVMHAQGTQIQPMVAQQIQPQALSQPVIVTTAPENKQSAVVVDIPTSLTSDHAVVKPDNVHSFLNMRAGLTYGLWQIGLMRDTQSKRSNEQIFIVVEGMDALGHAFFWRFDLTTKIEGETITAGFAKVNIQQRDNVLLTEREATLKNLLNPQLQGQIPKLVGHVWQLRREKVLDVYRTILTDKANGLLPYADGHSSSFFNVHGETCYSWAYRHLSALEEPKIQQDLPAQRADYLAMPPKWKLQDVLTDAEHVKNGEKSPEICQLM